eukprot:TRINITY_DN6306_c0_g2_i2.p1 TRINITY_DN6306_c0_g2~~TRINITY_DN6306_c0_g2_i2.p1  ORF type:complete len:205 (-),score=34.25 TRINITY_DN6306_c0_g2_i2:68-682(-)
MLGPLLLGQSQSVVVQFSGSSLQAELVSNSRTRPFRTSTSTIVSPKADPFQVWRTKFISVVTEAMKFAETDLPKAQKHVSDFKDELAAYLEKENDSKTQALFGDVEGQVTEAFSRLDWYKKWGEHYLPSLIRAHQLQNCNNFKDPGVQIYVTELFDSIRDVADDLFLHLPPPERSLIPPVTKVEAYAAPAADTGMRSYYDRCSG